MSASLRAASLVVGAVKSVVRRLPPGWKRALDDRLFAAIFQATRVTNDAYGWRPEPKADGGDRTPPPESA